VLVPPLLVLVPPLLVVLPPLLVVLPPLLVVLVPLVPPLLVPELPLLLELLLSSPQATPIAAAATTDVARARPRKLSFILMPIVVLPAPCDMHGALRPHRDKRHILVV
jgi:hypothetical protein